MDYYVDNDHMLQGPNVVHALVEPEASTQKIITPRTIILHTNAGPTKTPWEALIAFMRRADIVAEAHFQVDMAGTVVQAMPLNRKADCNFKANDFAISFETEDNGFASLSVTPWTFEQGQAIASAVAAIGLKYVIPFTDPARWDDSGVGYHSQFKEWSSYTGKTCPGAARIAQMPWIRSTAAAINAPRPSSNGPDDMRITIFTVRGCKAVFLAETTQSGVALNVRWSGEGTPKIEAMIAAQRAAGAVDATIDVQDLRNTFLLGALPHGDVYKWSKDDFAGLTSDNEALSGV